jgi:hypothetical protein
MQVHRLIHAQTRLLQAPALRRHLASHYQSLSLSSTHRQPSFNHQYIKTLFHNSQLLVYSERMVTSIAFIGFIVAGTIGLSFILRQLQRHHRHWRLLGRIFGLVFDINLIALAGLGVVQAYIGSNCTDTCPIPLMFTLPLLTSVWLALGLIYWWPIRHFTKRTLGQWLFVPAT